MQLFLYSRKWLSDQRTKIQALCSQLSHPLCDHETISVTVQMHVPPIVLGQKTEFMGCFFFYKLFALSAQSRQ